MMTKEQESRFWSKVSQNEKTGCWEWGGYLDEKGYGRVWLLGSGHRVHRLSWGVFNGSPPHDMQVLHKCDNRKCVNPKHLFLGDGADNVYDMISKGRSKSTGLKWEQHPRAKITNEEAKEIKKLYKTGQYSHKSLGRLYGLSAASIGYLLIGKSWRGMQ